MKMSLQWIAAVVVGGGIVGFPLAASLATAADVSSTPVSIVVRATVLGAALVLLLRPSLWYARGRGSLEFTLLMTFWALYLVRLSYESLANAEALGRPVSYYWIFAVGTCLVPILGCALSHADKASQRMKRAILWAAVVAASVALVFADTEVTGGSGEVYDSGRFALEALNPISFGHLGATIALLAYWKLRIGQPGAVYGGVLVALLGLGCYVILLSGSRGPLVALLMVVLLAEVAWGGARMMVLALTVSPLLLVLSYDLSLIDEALGVQIFARLETALQGVDESASLRVVLLTNSWGEFLANPLLGSGIEESTLRIYPHNLFLEGLMATGILGGACLIVFMLILVRRSLGLLRRRADGSWIAMLFLQALVGAQFSGSVYQNTALWTTAIVVAMTAARQGRAPKVPAGLRPRPVVAARPLQGEGAA